VDWIVRIYMRIGRRGNKRRAGRMDPLGTKGAKRMSDTRSTAGLSNPDAGTAMHLPDASERIGDWRRAWQQTGHIVVLLDFDGTLAPIVERPELAAMPETTRAAVERLRTANGVTIAVVSGRGLADARDRAAIPGVAYAGNHGMEIEGPGIRRVHEEAARTRPLLEAVAARLRGELEAVPDAIVEDKGLTLSIHYRLVSASDVGRVEQAVDAAVAGHDGLRVTRGKKVLEIRPRVDWHKGRAVEFLLDHIAPPADAPILYFGDDTTDEDAFRALRGWPGGEGIFVGEEPPPGTTAVAQVRTPQDVGSVLAELSG
jgi:trehalose 6-phosphate phosphatase